ncbi:MAG TPA: hypothetical protein VNO34_01810 [Actinomycetota bacterium]|nr:hypothetical protein [Actinomycetota bacterium]
MARVGAARRTLTLFCLFALAGSASVAGATWAAAGKSDKKASVDLQPTSLGAGTSAAFAVTVKNENGPDSAVALGSFDLDLTDPRLASAALCADASCASQATSLALEPVPGKRWSVQLCTGVGAPIAPCRGARHVAGKTNGTGKLISGQSLAFSVKLTAGCAAGDVALPATVWVATDGTGSTFQLVGGNRSLAITAETVATHLAVVSPTNTSALVEAGQAFDAVVQAQRFDAGSGEFVAAPVCGDTAVTLTEDGEGTLSQQTASGSVSPPTATIPSGGTEVTVGGVSHSLAENVTLCATASGLTPRCTLLNVQVEVASCSGEATSCTVGGPSGATALADQNGGACETDSTHPTCVTLIFPGATEGAVTLVGLSHCKGYFGLAAGDCLGFMVRFLADLFDDAGAPLYTRSNPWTMVVECDRTACEGGGVTKYQVSVDGDDDGSFVESPACVSSTHTTIDPSLTVVGDDGTVKPAEFCTDYVESHRDNAQDLILVIRLTSNADGGGTIHR